MSTTTGEGTSFTSPLQGLSKQQTKQLAQLVARVTKANTARAEAQAKLTDSRFMVKSGVDQKTHTAIYKAAEKALGTADLQLAKIGLSLDGKPVMKDALATFSALQQGAAGGNLDAKRLLEEVQTDFTLAMAPGPKKQAPIADKAAKLIEGAMQGRSEAASSGKSVDRSAKQVAEDVFKGLLNGIAAGKSQQAERDEAQAQRKKRETNEFQEPARYPKTLPARYTVRGADVVDKRTDQVAFVDKGNELRAGNAPDRDVVGLMIETAETRGWTPIRVFGTEAFKSMVWMQATSAGLPVVGYTPTKEEMALANQNLQINGKGNALAPDQREKPAEEPTKAQKLAKAFLDATNTKQQNAASKEHPELASAFALVKVFESQIASTGMSKKEARDFTDQFRDLVASRIEAEKKLPTVEVADRQSEKQQGRPDPDQER